MQAAHEPDPVRDRCIAMGMEVLAAEQDHTVVFSPTSWCMTLGMLAAGASGEGRAQVEAALGADIETVVETCGSWSTLFDANDVDPGSIKKVLPERPVVHQANNVVLREDIKVADDYLEAVQRNFDTGVMQTDLASPAGKRALDQWVREHTGGRIRQSAVVPSPELLLVLQDALFFASRWRTKLHSLREAPFTRADGVRSFVPYFGGTLRMGIGEHDGWLAGRLAFDGAYSARFFLPPETGVPLTPEIRAALSDGLQMDLVRVAVPDFEAETRMSLLPWFDRFGMPALLESGSLEGIAPDAGLRVGDAVQQAKVTVDEAGVVAVAVTELVAASGAPGPAAGPKELILNRPFVMTIGHDETGLDLFQIAVASIDG